MQPVQDLTIDSTVGKAQYPFSSKIRTSLSFRLGFPGLSTLYALFDAGVRERVERS